MSNNLIFKHRYYLLFFIFISTGLFSFLGITLRPIHLFSALWPTNAFLIALWLINKKEIPFLGYVCTFLGYILADLITGTQLYLAIQLAITNSISVFTSIFIFYHYSDSKTNLKTPKDIVILSLSIATGSIFCSAYSMLFVYPQMHTSYDSTTIFYIYWSVSEFFNNTLLTPVFFALLTSTTHLKNTTTSRFKSFPLIALMISIGFSYYITGLGTIVFIVPALLWCAFSYSSSFSTVLTLLSCLSQYGLLIEFLNQHPHYGRLSLNMDQRISVQVGLALLSYAPIFINIINQQNQILLHNLKQQADIDPLTLISNRRRFFHCLEMNFANEKNLSILYIDIDFFKQINDQYGHIIGDQVLINFTKKINLNIRIDDIFARIGGEEFGLILPNTTPQQSIEMANRLRTLIAQSQITTSENQAIFITMSVGIRHIPLFDKENISHYIHDADKALYQAKKTGRNKVILYSSELAE